MGKLARYLVGIVGGLVLTAGTAAADRTMVVVIDQTGSMLLTRPSDGMTRFEAAKLQAADRVFEAGSVETLGLSGVQVFTFHNDFFSGEFGLTDRSMGFIPWDDARDLILTLTMPSGATPLAGSMCDAIDAASASGSGSTTARFFEVYTDGGENNTDPAHPCAGFHSSSTSAPFDLGSWQNKVYNYNLDATPAVTTSATLLYHDVSPLWVTTPLSDEDFFAALTRDTGGTLTLVDDSAPLPVFGDIDGDYDVDRDDAIALALRFGDPASAGGDDLDGDGKIGFSDYQLVLSLFGTGHNPPEADPYTQGQTVRCGSRDHEVVIDGAVIEDAGVTISVRGECTVVIRNSLIVSGKAAIRVRGAADLVVDNSIIAGEGAWLDSAGTTSLSASGSVFHGAEDVNGDFDYDDRGGNTFGLGGDDGTESGSPASLSPDDGDLAGGCSAGGGASGSSLLFALFAALIVVRRRRE